MFKKICLEIFNANFEKILRICTINKESLKTINEINSLRVIVIKIIKTFELTVITY